MPDSVTSIEMNAFSQCTALEKITIGKGVKSIGTYAFINSDNIKEVNYTGSVASWCAINFICKSAGPLHSNASFYIDGEQVTDLVIPDEVTSVPAYAFYKSAGIRSLTIGDGVTDIGDNAFSSMRDISSVQLGKNIENIGQWALSSIKTDELIIPGAMTEINSYAFANSDIKNLYMGTNIKTVQSGSLGNVENFYYDGTVADWCDIVFVGSASNPMFSTKNFYFSNELLSSLEIPDTVTEIKDYAFYNNNKKITSIVLPEGLVSVGVWAFVGSNADSVTIPASVTSIGEKAFGYQSISTKLTDFTVYGKEGSAAEQYALDNGFAFIALEEPHVHDFASSVTKPATCKEEGIRTFVCDCGESYTEPIAVLTYHTDGDGDGYCDVCSEKLTPDEPDKYAHLTVSYADDILTVSGNGEIPSCAVLSERPWDEYKDTAKAVIVTGGIEKIGENAFGGFGEVTIVVLDGVKNVESAAFSESSDLRNIVCFGAVNFAENALFGGNTVQVFAENGNTVGGDIGSNAKVISFEKTEDTMSFDGHVMLSMYDMLDIIAVLSSRFDNIMTIHFDKFTAADFSIWVYNEEGDLEEIENNTLEDANYTVMVDNGDDLEQVSFNELCILAQDEDFAGFYLLTESSNADVEETPVIMTLWDYIVYAIKWIVTLMNKIFSIFTRFK